MVDARYATGLVGSSPTSPTTLEKLPPQPLPEWWTGETKLVNLRLQAEGRSAPLNPALALWAYDEIVRLQTAIREIQRATVEGRVCDDVAWFDMITTLHDYCDQTLNPG